MSKERNRVSVGNRLAIKGMWEDGLYTVRDIAKTLRMNEPTVYSIIQRNGWEKGSVRQRIIDEHESQIQEAFDQEQAEKERVKLERIERWDTHQNALFQMLTNAQLKIHTKFQKGESSLGMQMDDAKALNVLASTFRLTQQAAKDLFGESAQEDDSLPELIVTSMDDQDIESIRSQQETRYRSSSDAEEQEPE